MRVVSSLSTAYGRHFLGAELVLSAVVTMSFGLWVGFFAGEPRVSGVLMGDRAVLYGALVSLFGAMLGFVIATTTIILGFVDSARLKVLRESPWYRDLWRTLNSTMLFLGGATLASLVALVFDRDAHPNSVCMVVCFGATLVAGARIARTLWILVRIIGLVTTDRSRAIAAPTA